MYIRTYVYTYDIYIYIYIYIHVCTYVCVRGTFVYYMVPGVFFCEISQKNMLVLYLLMEKTCFKCLGY